METAIVVALIGAAGVVIAAIIDAVAKSKEANQKFKIKQKSKGNDSIQIGVQNNYKSDEGTKDE